MRVVFDTYMYLQNVTTVPCKVANNVRVHLVLQITGSNTVINTCIEQLTA